MAESNGAVKNSVQHFEEEVIPGGSDSQVFLLGQQADNLTAWGQEPKRRDRELRNFIATESTFSSALGIVCARNAAFSWNVEGPPRKAQRGRELLDTAQFGQGWVSFITRISIDLHTQDSGAFIEVIRENNDSPKSPVIGIAHLDAQNCYPTGNPEVPVIYVDKRGGYHEMKWWQVQHLLEMPAPSDYHRELQYCALTRLFRAAQILKDVSIYIAEKVGGRHSRAIIGAQGITSKQMEEALEQAKHRANDMGLMRYSAPIVVGSKDPESQVDFKTLELSSIPDNFDLDLTFKQYITQIAMAFLSDYQEFAPLPGGNLGTSSQSEILHMKSRGKGPALFQTIMETSLNWNILPEDVEMRFHEQDSEEEKARVDLGAQRAEARAMRLKSGEITTTVARMLARDDGDLDEEHIEVMDKEDEQAEESDDDRLESGSPVVDEAEEREVEDQEDAPDNVGADMSNRQAQGGGGRQSGRQSGRQNGQRRRTRSRSRSRSRARKDDDYSEDPEPGFLPGPPPDRDRFEDLVAKRIEESFRNARERVEDKANELLTGV